MGRKGKELCLEEKQSILSLRKASLTLQEISDIIGRPLSTVHTFLKRHGTTKDVENKPRSGRPKKCSAQDERQIFRMVKMNRRQSLTELTNVRNEIGPGTVSESTVKRILNRDGYRRRLVKKKMRVREVNKTKRVKWCKEAKKRTVDDHWKKVIFTDECKVMIDGERRVYVWRKAGEEWDPPCIAPHAGRRLDLMIWGCITYNGVGTLCVVDGNINAHKYIEIIDNHLCSVVAAHFPSNDYLFQDENAPVHRARSVKEFMEQENIPTMEWPAQSPDLNIIENCSRKLKQELCKRVQNLRTANDLETAIRQVWENIHPNFIQDLYKSIPRRIQAVIKAKGCLTKY